MTCSKYTNIHKKQLITEKCNWYIYVAQGLCVNPPSTQDDDELQPSGAEVWDCPNILSGTSNENDTCTLTGCSAGYYADGNDQTTCINDGGGAWDWVPIPGTCKGVDFSVIYVEWSIKYSLYKRYIFRKVS